MGLFYAYAKNINDDVTYRYLIVFATRAVADQWWRAIQTAKNTAYTTSIKRVTPQFYTHDPGLANIALSIVDPNVAKQFLGQIFFTLLNDRDGRILDIIPLEKITDHISGGWYYIRSRSDDHLFWWLNPADNRIYLSRTQRTRFQVSIPNVADSTGTVIIDSDQIYITPSSNTVSIGVGNNGVLIDGIAPTTFTFADFRSGFAVDNNSNDIVRSANGEAWELVN